MKLLVMRRSAVAECSCHVSRRLAGVFARFSETLFCMIQNKVAVPLNALETD
jgi:hypothetical protein